MIHEYDYVCDIEMIKKLEIFINMNNTDNNNSKY